ncbi:hypothetical protein D3C73_1092770 [compost metagenome]
MLFGDDVQSFRNHVSDLPNGDAVLLNVNSSEQAQSDRSIESEKRFTACGTWPMRKFVTSRLCTSTIVDHPSSLLNHRLEQLLAISLLVAQRQQW